jgi:hypothetical protein
MAKINENKLRQIVRESLEEISWSTAMRAGEISDTLSSDLRELGDAAVEFANSITKFYGMQGANKGAYEQICDKYGLFKMESYLTRLAMSIYALAKKKAFQSDNFKTSTTAAEENYLNKNGVITNYDDIEV